LAVVVAAVCPSRQAVAVAGSRCCPPLNIWTLTAAATLWASGAGQVDGR
jgi:hypothetical protein